MEPSLLIASPQMRDPFFSRAVVLVWHHDEDGAIGVIVNRPLEHGLQDVLELGDRVDLEAYRGTRVAWGGPVEPGTGTVVTLAKVPDEEGWNLPCGVSVTRSHDALVRLLQSGEPLLLCLGYAGWGPGQLDKEIEQGGWLSADPSPEIVFATSAEERYEAALASLGLQEHQVWMMPVAE